VLVANDIRWCTGGVSSLRPARVEWQKHSSLAMAREIEAAETPGWPSPCSGSTLGALHGRGHGASLQPRWAPADGFSCDSLSGSG
jgi:hypothetical protein